MFKRFLDWIKLHKLTTVLLLVVFYFLWQYSSRIFGLSTMSLSVPSSSRDFDSVGVQEPSFGQMSDSSTFSGGTLNFAPQKEFAPTSEVTNRLVVQNSSLSILVTNVVEARNKVLEYTNKLGGYMVEANTSNPEESATSTVTLRIPTTSLDAALSYFRGLGVKVVSENLRGSDVTDQYVDINARVETLEKTKVAMQAILDRAVQINDLTNITQQIINIQSQIDSLKGQQKSLEANAQMTKVTLFLSTDEIALPYTPNETFRPEVIIKLAVRSLITHMRSLATLAIWVVIYAVIWVPPLAIIYFLNRRFGKKSQVTP